MSFKKTVIPGLLMAGLYKETLYQLNQPDSVISKKDTLPEPWFLGNNHKHIVIAVRDQEAIFLRDEWLQFLSTILTACKLNLGDVAIINFAHHQKSFTEISESLQTKIFLSFGIAAKELELSFTVPDYQVQLYDQRSFLWAVPIQHIYGDSQLCKIEKSKLWLCLKKIFAV